MVVNCRIFEEVYVLKASPVGYPETGTLAFSFSGRLTFFEFCDNCFHRFILKERNYPQYIMDNMQGRSL